jgi:hypothetical protein
MEYLLNTDEVRSGRTTDATKVPAEKVLLIQSLDRAQIFRGVFVGCFAWSSMESLLHTDEVRSGRTTEGTKIPAKKVHNF